MDDLQYKYKLLEAKFAAKQAELDETNNKLNRAASSNSQIDQHKQTIKVLEKKLAAAEKQITQLQNGQITDAQKSKNLTLRLAGDKTSEFRKERTATAD